MSKEQPWVGWITHSFILYSIVMATCYNASYTNNIIMSKKQFTLIERQLSRNEGPCLKLLFVSGKFILLSEL